MYLIDENDTNNKKMINSRSKYTNRSCTCGELNIENVGERVILCGWLEYNRMNKFVVLRDSYGETQVILSEKVRNIFQKTNHSKCPTKKT